MLLLVVLINTVLLLSAAHLNTSRIQRTPRSARENFTVIHFIKKTIRKGGFHIHPAPTGHGGNYRFSLIDYWRYCPGKGQSACCYLFSVHFTTFSERLPLSSAVSMINCVWLDPINMTCFNFNYPRIRI